MLREIFGSRRDEVTGEWRNLHNKELNNLYCSLNIIRMMKSRRMRWVGHVGRMAERKAVYRVLVGKPEAKRPFERPRCRWEDNIKMDLEEVGCRGYCVTTRLWAARSAVRIPVGSRAFPILPNIEDPPWGPSSFQLNGSTVPSPAVKRPGCDFNSSSISRTEVTNEWSCTSYPLLHLHAVDRGKSTLCVV